MSNDSTDYYRVEEAKSLIAAWGDIDGSHHKQWLIDQVLRALLGTDEAYKKWVNDWEAVRFEEDPDGTAYYEWNEGVAP